MSEGIPLRFGRRLYRGALTGANATLYAVPSGRSAQVVDIQMCNTDAAARTVTLRLGGQSLFSAVSLAAGETLSWSGVQVLHDGELVEGSASAAGVVAVHITGAEN